MDEPDDFGLGPLRFVPASKYAGAATTFDAQQHTPLDTAGYAVLEFEDEEPLATAAVVEYEGTPAPVELVGMSGYRVRVLRLDDTPAMHMHMRGRAGIGMRRARGNLCGRRPGRRARAPARGDPSDQSGDVDPPNRRAVAA